jgi:trehalose/maltose hydrolase-like predicted phosphorylase
MAILRSALSTTRIDERPQSGTRASAHQPLERWAAVALQPTAEPDWVLQANGYAPLHESAIESRFAISNGLLGIRGSRIASRGPMWMSFLHTLSWASWPRTFVAGLFDTPDTEPPVPVLVPAPDWLRLRVLFDGKHVLMRSGELLSHSRTLDLRRGALTTEWHQRDPDGRVLRWRALRLVSMADRSLGLQVVQFSVDDRPARVTLDASFEMVSSDLELMHHQPHLAIWRTASSGKLLAIASVAGLHVDGRALPPATEDQLRRSWAWTLSPGQVATFWRIAAVTRGDNPRQDPGIEARAALERARRIGGRGVLDAHVAAWRERWAASDVLIEGDEDAQRALRFAIYHLNSAANPDDERVSIGARGLTGDDYLGHVFWDTEIYVVPFYTFTWPAAARALLMYRYHTLPGARAKAARLGYRGALFAWESADTGEETTPEQIVDTRGRVVDILCGKLEHHISADVAYAVWQYWQATEDERFLIDAGAEILLETARFWSSRAQLEPDGQYHIRQVIGPDEYHERIDDNAFTNGMARWNLERGLEIVALLRERWTEHWPALASRLELAEPELHLWRDVATRLVTGLDTGTGLFEQFAGYFGLEDLNLGQYEGRTVPMDVVLGRERTQGSQVIKQADVVALLALLPDMFEPRVHEANFGYYEPRCGHGSSLSRGLHAVVAARLGLLELAERYFRATAATDLEDRTGASGGGIRIAALGALWQAALFGFVGLMPRPDGLAFNPRLPPAWHVVSLRVQWRGRRLHVRLEQAIRLLTATVEQGAPMTLLIDGRRHVVEPGHPVRVTWTS